MLAILLANHLLGLLLWRSFTADEVEINKVMIEKDGAANTLGKGFHERRTWIRFWAWLGVTALGAVPAAAFIGWAAIGWGFAALGVLLAGYFLRTFSPSLNAAMKLAYKPRFYVSLSATASLLDRFVVKLALWLTRRGWFGIQVNPDKVFQNMLNVCLVLTLLVYVALLLPLTGA